MRIRSNLISVTVITAALLLASCGGSDSSGTSGTPISKADFVEKANALCTKTNENVTTAQDALGASATQEQIISFLTDVVVPAYRDTISEIRGLGFPAGDEALLGGLLDDADKVVSDIAKDPAAILAAAQSPFTDVNVGFTDYGLTACAEV
jgi:hypothetical protein